MEGAQGKANEVAEARDEEVPYPNRATQNLDDPAYAEGDAVMWTWDGEPVHGRVADVGEEFTVSGNTITGEDGEAVYLIHEWDDGVEAFRRENVAKPESSLSESSMEMPAATDDNFQSMTDDSPPDDGGTTDEQTADDGETTERAPDDVTQDDLLTFVAMHFEGMDESDLATAVDTADGEYIGECDPEALADLVSVATGAEYGDVVDAMDDLMAEGGEDVPDDEQGDYGDDDEEDGDEDEGEQSSDGPDETQAAAPDEPESDLREEVRDLREELDELRAEGQPDVETPGDETPDDGQRDTTGTQDAKPAGGLGDYR